MEVIAIIVVLAGWIAAPMIVAFVAVETRNGGLPRSAWAILGMGVLLGSVAAFALVLIIGGKLMNWTDAAILWPLVFSVSTALVAVGRRVASVLCNAVKRRKSHAV